MISPLHLEKSPHGKRRWFFMGGLIVVIAIAVGLGMKMLRQPHDHNHQHSTNELAVPARAALAITDYQRQLLGLTTAKAERKQLTHEVRTVGQVAFDPLLATAQREYLEARRLGDAELVSAATERLKIMGMNRAQIDALAKDGRIQKNLYSPLETGKKWIYATIYEMDIPSITLGQEMAVSLPDRPDAKFTGHVTSIDSIVDLASRTLRARGEVDDPQGLLKPARVVDVHFRTEHETTLVIPRSALLTNGETHYTFIDRGAGHIEPQQVTPGVKGGTEVQILAGLEEGDTVVTSAIFLIDAESALRATASSLEKKGALPSCPDGEHWDISMSMCMPGEGS